MCSLTSLSQKLTFIYIFFRFCSGHDMGLTLRSTLENCSGLPQKFRSAWNDCPGFLQCDQSTRNGNFGSLQCRQSARHGRLGLHRCRQCRRSELSGQPWGRAWNGRSEKDSLFPSALQQPFPSDIHFENIQKIFWKIPKNVFIRSVNFSELFHSSFSKTVQKIWKRTHSHTGTKQSRRI